MWVFLLLQTAIAGDILFATEVCRHGARAPNRFFSFQSEYWKDYEPGQLTELGMRQSYLIGVELRRRYVEEWALFNSTYRPTEVYVQSTSKDRAIETAYSQLAGLFPARTGRRLPPGLRVPMPMAVRDAERIERELGDAALPYLIAPVPVHVDDGDHVLHGYKDSICPRMGQIRKLVKSSPAWKSLEERAVAFMRDGGWGEAGREVSGAKQLCSAVMCDLAQGNPIPSSLDLSTLKPLHRDIVLQLFLHPEAQVLTCSEFFRRLLRHFADSMEGGNLRFALYSAHDYTLIAFMACLGVDIKEIPAFASTLVLELYSDLTVRVFYNGEPLDSASCASGHCPLSSFQTHLQQFIVTDIDQACELQ